MYKFQKKRTKKVEDRKKRFVDIYSVRTYVGKSQLKFSLYLVNCYRLIFSKKNKQKLFLDNVSFIY